MLSTRLNPEIRFVCRSVLRFLDRSLSRAMGCFFGCFRIRDDRSRTHLVSQSIRSNSTDGVTSKNRLSTLFLSEEKEDSLCSEKRNISLGSPEIDKGLKNEAKFLKACGTIPETPVEIRKASQKLKGLPSWDPDSESSKYHSWLPNMYTKKVLLDKQPGQAPNLVKLCEEQRRLSVSSEQAPSSCISNVQSAGRISDSSSEGSEQGSVNTSGLPLRKSDENTPSVSPLLSSAVSQCRNRSVRFECDLDVSSSRGSLENINEITKKVETPGNRIESRTYLNLTPLNLSDEMQTPGTVFPTNLEKLGVGKMKLRSQYVCSVLNPIENVSQLKALKEEESDSSQLLNEVQDSMELPEGKTPRSEVRVKESSPGKESKVEASLSSWLKPQPSAYNDNSQTPVATSDKLPPFGRTPGDRPIIGMVAAHWIEDESSHISPKWWDGNGIPNSTNKYKEDQKVSWHATPFEERLEKALSEESFISQRKPIDEKPTVFDSEEIDTALSELRPSTHSKSVVSF